ncbi:hypothetical protein [Klebsiella phage phiKp_21]|nr:hypothetical protein [Klebsiella phage phiKp_21]
MTYRDYFCIFEVLVFTSGSLVLLLHYFCVEPFYKLLKPKTEMGVFCLFQFMYYYFLSILSVVVEVIFGGFVNADKMPSYELFTTFNVLMIALIVFVSILAGIYKFFVFLGNKHNDIVLKRKGTLTDERN